MLDLRLKMADVEDTNEMNVGKGKYMAESRIFQNKIASKIIMLAPKYSFLLFSPHSLVNLVSSGE